MFGFRKNQIRAAIVAALPRLDTAEKVALWLDLFCGWLTIHSGTATTITAPTTATASNVARRAWKNQNGEKGTVAVALKEWNYETGLLVKRSTATATGEGMRVAITQAVEKILANLPDTDGDPRVAVSHDPHGDGVIVTAYWLDRGKVRAGG